MGTLEEGEHFDTDEHGRNVELTELHRFKDEMTALLVHDLKNPLSATEGLAAALYGEPRWDHSVSAWGLSMLAIGGLTVVTVVGAGFALRRYDPHRS